MGIKAGSYGVSGAASNDATTTQHNNLLYSYINNYQTIITTTNKITSLTL